MSPEEQRKTAITLVSAIATAIVVGGGINAARTAYIGYAFAETEARVVASERKYVGSTFVRPSGDTPWFQTTLELDYTVNGHTVRAHIVSTRSIDPTKPVPILYRKYDPQFCILR